MATIRNIISRGLILAGFLTTAVFSAAVSAQAAPEGAAEAVTVTEPVQVVVGSVSAPADDQLSAVEALPGAETLLAEERGSAPLQEVKGEDSRPQVVASIGTSILQNSGESGLSIDASTVLESSSGLVLEIPETKVEPTEQGENNVLTSTEEVLPPMGVTRSQPRENETSVVGASKKVVPAPRLPVSEESAGLPYAIILALFALISLIPVARRSDHHHHV